MKFCFKCKQDKSEDSFHKNKSSKTGLSSYCKSCSIAAASAYNKKNKDKVIARSDESKHFLSDLVDSIKEKSGCSFCSEKTACCLDFHHINDDKENNISHFTLLKKRKQLFDEINKCIIVCSNCHRKIHKGLLNCDDKEVCKVDIADYFEERHGRFYKK